ncbi:MAG: type II toxin-antitoxin system RelE/ParE family toxin [Scandinavium sp.]|uniref:type II toxin-antitoxin system RelE/ParE family toxin n=1 Tax=Scandinavium sp. TaxID=2830653 RepID=UPI003F2D9890
MWVIKTTDTFDEWFIPLPKNEKRNVTTSMLILSVKGPNLSRPYADTVQGSRFHNLKELRIQSHGDPLRAFYAFTPDRCGLMLCAERKVGHEKRFYKKMLPLAEHS